VTVTMPVTAGNVEPAAAVGPVVGAPAPDSTAGHR